MSRRRTALAERRNPAGLPESAVRDRPERRSARRGREEGGGAKGGEGKKTERLNGGINSGGLI